MIRPTLTMSEKEKLSFEDYIQSKRLMEYLNALLLNPKTPKPKDLSAEDAEIARLLVLKDPPVDPTIIKRGWLRFIKGTFTIIK